MTTKETGKTLVNSHTVKFESRGRQWAVLPDDDDICQEHVNRSTVINLLAAKGIGRVEVKERLDKMPVCANRQCRVAEENALDQIKK